MLDKPSKGRQWKWMICSTQDRFNHRVPTETELKVWILTCLTTFVTRLETSAETQLLNSKAIASDLYDKQVAMREELGRPEKPQTFDG